MGENRLTRTLRDQIREQAETIRRMQKRVAELEQVVNRCIDAYRTSNESDEIVAHDIDAWLRAVQATRDVQM